MKINSAIKIVSVLLILILLAIFSYLYISFALTRKNSERTELVTLRIENGMSTRRISDLLAQSGLINSSTLFSLYVRATGAVLQAGVYQVPSNLSMVEMSEFLQHGTDDLKLTIPEGLRAEEIAEAAKKVIPEFNSENFLAQIKERKLEGFLFPDTYFIKKDTTEEELIGLLLDTFTAKTAEINFSSGDHGLSRDEVVILASIVEREEPTPAERPTVARILLNRLKNGEVLGADATTQYLIGKPSNWWPKTITASDLSIESPYNTRKNAGLPPTPICNPGISAIRSVIDSKPTDFQFYLHDSDGNIHYARNMEEHLANIERYLRN